MPVVFRWHEMLLFVNKPTYEAINPRVDADKRTVHTSVMSTAK